MKHCTPSTVIAGRRFWRIQPDGSLRQITWPGGPSFNASIEHKAYFKRGHR